MNILRTIKGYILRINDNDALTLTNQDIIEILVKHFKKELLNRSTEGGSVIYPMKFTIILEYSDYQRHYADFELFVEDIIERFYEIIRKYKKNRKDKHPATSWVFEIISSTTGNIDFGNDSIDVVKGTPVIISSLYDVNELDSPNGFPVSVSVGQTVISKEFNINPEVFKNFKQNNGKIVIPWKDPFKKAEEKETVKKTDESEHLKVSQPYNQPSVEKIKNPTLAYRINYKNSYTNVSHEIVTDICYICGRESQETNNTFKINSSKVMTPHAILKKNKETGIWSIAAFATTTLGDNMQLNISTQEKPQWTELSQSVNINLNGFVIRFKIS